LPFLFSFLSLHLLFIVLELLSVPLGVT